MFEVLCYKCSRDSFAKEALLRIAVFLWLAQPNDPVMIIYNLQLRLLFDLREYAKVRIDTSTHGVHQGLGM
jgi:hypothetical protein